MLFAAAWGFAPYPTSLLKKASKSTFAFRQKQAFGLPTILSVRVKNFQLRLSPQE
jgi:hypothetical protein